MDFCDTEFWNSSLTWYTDDPDFTRCFEETILLWLPCAFIWVMTPFEIYFMRTNLDRDIPWNFYNITKLLLNCGLIILSIVELIIIIVKDNSYLSDLIYPVDKYSAGIKFLTLLLLLCFIPLNRKYGIRTSGCQFMFWFFIVIFSIPRCRTEIRDNWDRNRVLASGQIDEPDYSWEEYKFNMFMIFFVLSCLMFLWNCRADGSPRKTKYKTVKAEIPERSASFVSRLVYHWFDKMAWYGYRKPLAEHDLWDLRPQELTREVMEQFSEHWKHSSGNYSENIESKGKTSPLSEPSPLEFQAMHKAHEHPKSPSTQSILYPIMKTFGSIFLFGAILKLGTDLLTFVNPQVLRLIIGHVESNEEHHMLWHGICYAILLFITVTMQTLLLCHYFHQMFIAGLQIRSALIHIIYRKALIISHTARQKFTTGEIVNLMAVHTQRFMDLTTYLNMIWSAPLQIGLALYFLWQQLGIATLAGLAIMIVLIPINSMIANRMKSYHMQQMKYKDERIRLMTQILSGIKVLKLYAWENSFEKEILNIRDNEILTLKKTAYLNAITSFLMFCASFLVSLATFGTYVFIDESNVLNVEKAFVSLSLFNILSFPLSTLPMLITNIVQTQVSIKRINEFLSSEELDPDNVSHVDNQSHPLTIRDGVFAWDSVSAPTLKNINMTIERNTLNAIVGTVGSGKSSIIQACLGEMQKLSGHVNRSGRVAYVPQQAWIQNASIRENILFGSPLDRKRYQQVIYACALQADLVSFAAGDRTEIGERGINLSGGQKQRVSLARAVYSNADIYLLDDPLSAVDAHVGKHIFKRVIGPRGLLGQKTRVFVTHNITFLPKTDIIFVLKGGEVTESGTYQSLLRNKGAFAEFLQQYAQQNDENAERDISGSSHAPLARLESLSDGISFDVDDERDDEDVRQPPEESKIICTEKLETESVEFSVYKYYARGIGFNLLLVVLLLILIYQAFQIASNLWLARWSNDKNADNDPSLRDMYLGVYGGLGAGQVFSSFLAAIAIALGCVRCARELHTILLRRVMRWPMELFDTTPMGRVINRFSKDIDTLDNVLPQNLRMFLMQAFLLLGTIIVICISTPLFAAVIVPIAIVYVFIQRIYVATSRQLMRLESISRSPVYSHFDETIGGAVSIRAYSVQSRFIEMSDAKVDANNVSKYPSLIANRWLSIRLEMIGNLVIFFAALFAVLSRDNNSGLVGLSISYALQITDTLKWLVRLSSDIETNIVSVERIKEYEESRQEADWIIEKTDPSNVWPAHGCIVFDDIKLRYRENLDLVLKGISFRIESGEKVGIVGRTGAGKSSLTLALFRLIEAADGEILIDNVEISRLGLHKLRMNLTIIPQDPVLFSGTLRFNLDPFASKSDAEIWHALKLAHLYEFVRSQAAGLYHPISEANSNLSVGQCQLVCLARALLRKTKVLILDEATAAVDLETDDLIQQTIRKEFKDCTVLTIAHRLNTILDSNRILVLDKGQVAEFAAPAELLSNENSIFYGMAKDANLI